MFVFQIKATNNVVLESKNCIPKMRLIFLTFMKATSVPQNRQMFSLNQTKMLLRFVVL